MAERSLAMRIRSLRGEARREAITGVLSEYDSSGLSAAAFCRSAGISSVTLTRWRRHVQSRRRRVASASGFVEILPSRVPAGSEFGVTLPGGVILRVAPGFDAAELSRLLAVLRSAC